MSEQVLRKNAMMAHLLDALDDGKDIGHYGRLVFTIVARHFLSDDDLISWLTRDEDVDETKARGLLHQVKDSDYSPPSSSTIRGYEKQQDFPILANPDDPDAGNVYQDLDFPESVYDSISNYHAEKAES